MCTCTCVISVRVCTCVVSEGVYIRVRVRSRLYILRNIIGSNLNKYWSQINYVGLKARGVNRVRPLVYASA